MSKRTNVFVSYSHADKEYLDRLKVHLRPFERRGKVDLWSDTKIKTGQNWRIEIKQAIERSAVAVLLVSADFLASDFVEVNELSPLLSAAKQECVTILPVVLKPCAFLEAHEISQFQSVNKPSKPLISCSEAEREAIWVQVVEAVHEAMRKLAQVPYEGQLLTTSNKNFDWTLELLQSAIIDPSVVDKYVVYQYQHIDLLELMPIAGDVLQAVPNREEVLQAIRSKFRSSGWEGDGEIQLMWIPPFVGPGDGDTLGLVVWFVKQSNNGTAFIASPVKLPFSRLLDQQSDVWTLL